VAASSSIRARSAPGATLLTSSGERHPDAALSTPLQSSGAHHRPPSPLTFRTQSRWLTWMKDAGLSLA
jgi:hypothetical protein